MSLRDLVRAEVAASLSPAERQAPMRQWRLYFERPEEPGFLVSETEEGPMVPVFTSREGLALFAGPCGWASTTVADLVELLPEGVRALVDPLGPRTFVLDTDAFKGTDDGTATDAALAQVGAVRAGASPTAHSSDRASP